MRHMLFFAFLVCFMSGSVVGQDAKKPMPKVPASAQNAWNKAEKAVQKNRGVYEEANAKAINLLAKELGKINQPDADDILKTFQNYIAGLDAAEAPPPPPPPDKNVVLFNGHRYKLFLKAVSWDDAQKECAALGGHLLTIADSNEQAAIDNALKTFREQHPELPNMAKIWLGFTQDKAQQKWINLQGQPQLYQNWEPLQPKDYHDKAAVFFRHGRWFSSDTKGPHFFICEWDK